MEDRLDEVKNVCVSDTTEMEEQQHLQQTEVKKTSFVLMFTLCITLFPSVTLIRHIDLLYYYICI